MLKHPLLLSWVLECMCVQTGFVFIVARCVRFYLSRPSWAAAPPGMILVMKMLGSSPTWGLSVPPAMLKPRPELPCNSMQTKHTVIHVQEKVFLWLHAVLWKNKKHSSIELLQQHFSKADVCTLTGTLKYPLFLSSSHSVVDLLLCLGSLFCFLIRLGFCSRLTLDYFSKQWSLCLTQCH